MFPVHVMDNPEVNSKSLLRRLVLTEQLPGAQILPAKFHDIHVEVYFARAIVAPV
jgi:hypothetical protein